MGKRIKSTGIILDASSTGSAPVSPSGTVALRAKADSTQFQYSANGGAWTDFGGGGAGGAVTGKWLWSNSTAGAPATGVVAINNADPSAATEIRIHETSNDSTAFATSFDSVIPGSDIYVQDFDDATRWVRYTVTAPATDHGDYRSWPVSLDSYGGVNLNNGEVVNILFITSGSGSIPRLDQLLDPMATKTFAMSTYQLGFTWSGSGGAFVFNKYVDSTEPAVLYFNKGRGTSTSPTDLVHEDVAGAIIFQGRLSGSFTSLGYIRGWYDSTFGARVDIGAGVVDQSRVAITHSGSTGSVTLVGGTTNYFQVQSAGFQFSHGTTGSLYYKDAAGYFVSLDIDADPTGGTDENKVLTVTNVSGSLLPRWVVSGGAPRLDQILDPTANKTFAMSTYDLELSWVGAGGTFTFYKYVDSAEPIVQYFYRARGTASTPADLIHGDVAGALVFSGRLSDDYRQFGYIRAWYDSATYAHMDLGAGIVDQARVTMTQSAELGTAALIVAPNYFQVRTDGYVLFGGGNGTLWYTNGSGFLVATATPPAADRIAFWDTSAGAVTWLTVGSGLTLTDTTLTAAGGGPATPGGTNLQVQYNNAGALGGVTGFEVSSTGGAPNMVLGGGYFQIAAGLTASVPNIDQEFFISATTAAATRFVMRCFRDITDGGYIQFDRSRGSQAAKTTLVHNDTTGKFVFNGYWDSAARQSGYIRSWYDGTYNGGRLDLGAGAEDDFARITLLDTGTSAGVTIYGNSSTWFSVQSSGYLLNGGGVGALWFSATGGYLVPTATPPAADRIAFWDSSAGTVTWLTAGSGLTITGTTMTAAGGGGTPGGSSGQLQYNSSGAFGGVTSSVVSGADVTLGGVLKLTAATTLTHILEKTTDVGSGTDLAKILFRENLSGVITDFGYLRAYWNASAGNNGVIEIGKSSTAFVGVSDVVAQMQFGIHYVQIQSGGIVMSSGVNSGVFYQSTGGAFLCTAAGTSSQYLKGGTAPSWGSIDASHITSGTLALARGGTGSSLTDPNADRIMFWDDSAGIVDWLIPGTGLTITDKTITAGSSAVFTSGNKALTDNTRTAIFSVSFDAADHLGVGGIVHFTVIAKQTSGSTQIQAYRVSATFTAVHYGSSTGFGRWGNTYNTDGVTSTGSIAFTFDCNGTNHPSYASGSNLYTFYITANSDLASPTGMIIYYNIEYTGEKAITLV